MSSVSVVGCKMASNNGTFNSILKQISYIGRYPPEYKPMIHGPYDPSRFYGQPDTPFGEVKLGELRQWLGRRSLSPISMAQAVARAYHRWARTGLLAKRHCAAPLIQVMCVMMAFQYWAHYAKIRTERRAKYH